MNPAVLLLSSFFATLRSSFRSLPGDSVAVYPDTELVEVEGWHTCTPGNSIEHVATIEHGKQ